MPQSIILFDLIGAWCGMQYYSQAFSKVFPDQEYQVEVCSNYRLDSKGEVKTGGQLPMVFGVNKLKGVMRILQCWLTMVKILLSQRHTFIIYMAYGEFYDLPFLLTAAFSHRIVADVHEVHALKYGDESWVAGMFRWLYSHLFRTVIYHSDRTHQALTTTGMPTERLIYIPHFAYNFPKTYDEQCLPDDIRQVFCSEGRTRYLFFGNLSDPKGADIAAQVFADLSDEERDKVELVIAGKNVGGFDFTPLRELSPHYHVFERHITDDELVYLYSHTDYVLLPYRKSSQSGIMAMAIYFRRPMLCTDIPYFQTMLSKFPSFGGIAPQAHYHELVSSTIGHHDDAHYYDTTDCDAYHEHPAIERFLQRFAQLRHLLSVMLLCIVWLVPQAAQAFGDWNIYNATPNTTRLQLLGDRLYTISGMSLCSYSTDTLDIDCMQHSRDSGLSGTSVQYILTVPTTQKLAIAYTDGNIDLMEADGTVHNIPDLANKTMSGDKSIYSINYAGKQLFVSGGFGFLVIDTEEGYVTQSYQSRFAIDLSFRWGDRLYRASSLRGLEYGEMNDNLSDDKMWHRLSRGEFCKAMCFTCSGNDYCWLLDMDGVLYELDADHNLHVLARLAMTDISVVGDKVFMPTSKDVVYVTDPSHPVFTPNSSSPFYDADQFTPAGEEGSFFMLLHSNIIYRASILEYTEGQRVLFLGDWVNTLAPDGIGTNYLGTLLLTENGFAGISRLSYISGYSNAHALPGLFTTFDAEDETFTNVDKTSLRRSSQGEIEFQGLTGVAADPLHDQRYAISSGMSGVYIIDHDTLLCRYNEKTTNGGIEAFDPTFASTRTSAVAYDEDGNLFVANSMQDTLLRCLTPDGKWLKFAHDGMAQVADARRILISQHDSYGLKWVLNDYGYQKSRVGIYYDGGTLADKHDDQTAYFTRLIDQDYNEYLLNYMYDLCEDQDGKIWVLTYNGPFVIEDPKATFEYAQKNPGLGKVRRVKIPRNDGTNLADYLMESTPCICMAVDNFNRKWIGTQEAGLYLLSADCITELQHFDTSNSPLLSNTILDLCYDAVTGLLYVSCEGGVLTYQTDAIEGADNFDDLYCYPNPVRPEFSGELRIMGLMNDSQVSITTMSGDLIFRTRSQGATATWDLHTADGQRCEPGVYLIHGVDSQGQSGRICRFLVL